MKITYRVNDQEHDIFYLNKKYDQIAKDLDHLDSDKKLLFITDKNVSKEITEKILTTLNFSGCKIFKIEFLGSKKNKDLKSVLKIIDFMIIQGFTRKSVILSMGGGVLGDLSALAASLYMRGIIYFHIPTTITSIVDSCIGGKTAINYQNIINSIGTYFHANKIYILKEIVDKLPNREFNSGIPEILKCGLIKDNTILNILKKQSKSIKERKSKVIKDLCFKSLKTKIHFFKNDVYEKNQRLILNFGHTFAHSIEMALEKNSKNKNEIIRHGEAVGIGLICEMKYSFNLKDNDILRLTKNILNLYNLPINLKHLKLNKAKIQNDIFKFLFLDKKRVSKHPRYIHLTKLGKTKICEMQDYEKINCIINELL